MTMAQPASGSRKFQRGLLAAGGALLAVYGLLLIPDSTPKPPPPPPGYDPVNWKADSLWHALEAQFNQARQLGCDRIAASTDQGFRLGRGFVSELQARQVGPSAEVYDSLQYNLFELATLVGACRRRLPEYLRLVTETRGAVKRQARSWDTDSATTNRLYKLLYGSRAALEEVMLQGTPDSVPALELVDTVKSQTPAAIVLGVTVHSGDVLVSRASDPVSALIAVGSDHPGVFSHDAVVYVDPKTNLAYVVESNSDRGVEIHTLEQYLQEVKLRVLVLRLRADLPALVANPMLPHEAATLILNRAKRNHIPYDFAMDANEPSRMYCSELLSSTFGQLHVRLWTGMSSISKPGVARWIIALGVRHLDPEEPSDLEYNPQLSVVAEWRDPDALFSDHLDNVVTEALLNGAERGDPLGYPRYLLPAARLLKLYSAALNLFGAEGPIPEGMSATVALRVLQYNRAHAAIKQVVADSAAQFKARRGYRAPEWDLLGFARSAKAELRPRGP